MSHVVKVKPHEQAAEENKHLRAPTSRFYDPDGAVSFLKPLRAILARVDGLDGPLSPAATRGVSRTLLKFGHEPSDYRYHKCHKTRVGGGTIQHERACEYPSNRLHTGGLCRRKQSEGRPSVWSQPVSVGYEKEWSREIGHETREPMSDKAGATIYKSSWPGA